MPTFKHPIAAILMHGMGGGGGGPPMGGPGGMPGGGPGGRLSPPAGKDPAMSHGAAGGDDYHCTPEQIKAGVDALHSSQGMSPDETVQAIYSAMEAAEGGDSDSDAGPGDDGMGAGETDGEDMPLKGK